ncbi:hypothetical protein Bpfe_027728, partial [Biomphalaria pfeifferi]
MNHYTDSNHNREKARLTANTADISPEPIQSRAKAVIHSEPIQDSIQSLYSPEPKQGSIQSQYKTQFRAYTVQSQSRDPKQTRLNLEPILGFCGNTMFNS